MPTRFEGNLVALITPFRSGAVDHAAFTKLVEAMIAGGVSGLVVGGTTGEAPTLSEQEFVELLNAAAQTSRKRVPVIAGVGTHSTEGTLKKIDLARKAPIDGLMVVTPYYNRPTPQGLYEHYRAVARHSPLPIMVYNVPARTGCNLTAPVMKRLLEFDTITTLKEASGNLDQISRIITDCGDRLSVLSGDDPLTLPILALGGRGVVSVVANLIPKEWSALVESYLKGETETARTIHERFLPFCQACFAETNPTGIKAALALKGLIAKEFRLPIVPMEAQNESELKQVMVALRLL